MIKYFKAVKFMQTGRKLQLRFVTPKEEFIGSINQFLFINCDIISQAGDAQAKDFVRPLADQDLDMTVENFIKSNTESSFYGNPVPSNYHYNSSRLMYRGTNLSDLNNKSMTLRFHIDAADSGVKPNSKKKEHSLILTVFCDRVRNQETTHLQHNEKRESEQQVGNAVIKTDSTSVKSPDKPNPDLQRIFSDFQSLLLPRRNRFKPWIGVICGLSAGMMTSAIENTFNKMGNVHLPVFGKWIDPIIVGLVVVAALTIAQYPNSQRSGDNSKQV